MDLLHPHAAILLFVGPFHPSERRLQSTAFQDISALHSFTSSGGFIWERHSKTVHPLVAFVVFTELLYLALYGVAVVSLWKRQVQIPDSFVLDFSRMHCGFDPLHRTGFFIITDLGFLSVFLDRRDFKPLF